MRAPCLTEMIMIRLPPVLMAAASEKARRNGMSRSELIRHAIRREVLGVTLQ